jgi:tetratricopeptide (TPR) repeat protein
VLTKANFTVKTLYYKGIKVEWNVEGQEECREWFRKTAIGLDKDTCEKLKEVHADAKAKLEAEQYSDAARAITAALKDVRSRDNFLTYQLKALLKKIDKEGDSRRVTAERSLQNEPERLALELEGLAKLFAGSDAGKRIQASLQRVRKPAAGAGTPDGSAGKETSVEKETPGGQDTKPPATTGSDTDDRKFLSKLNNAKLLAQAGKKEAAIENLKKLLQENPESKHAAEAQKLLDQLEKGGK